MQAKYHMPAMLKSIVMKLLGTAAIICCHTEATSNLKPKDTNSSSRNHTKIIILGAGMAGISFARTLYGQGETDFIILEGRDYVGGRVKDIKFGSITAQLGAGWIHHIGPENSVWRLKEKYGLKINMDNYDNFTVRNEDGGIEETSWTHYQNIKTAIKKLSSIRDNITNCSLPDIPLRTALEMVGWKPVTNCEHVIDYFLNDFENTYPPETLSLYQMGFTGTKPDAVVTDSRGYKLIVEKLAEEFATQIILNSSVNKISYTEDNVLVKTDSGYQYSADYVFVTFSTGVLQSQSVTFEPPLPEWKMKAIHMLRMGHYTKIFFKFPWNFWDHNMNYILFASKQRGYYPHWQNLDILGLFPNHNILLLTVTGAESLRIEKLANKEVTKEAMEVLQKMYGRDIPSPTDMVMSRWSLDPFSFGAYSSPVIGTDEWTYKHAKTPIGKRVWFGGEATTSSGDYGLVHGAHDGGVERAMTFLKCIREHICPTFEERKIECSIDKEMRLRDEL